jgi:hydroxypyruvate isomerase
MQAVTQSKKDTGRLKQAAMPQNFPQGMAFEDQVKIAAEAGCWGFDLAQPNNWPILKKYGMVCTAASGGGLNFNDGVIHPEAHDRIEATLHPFIDQCAEGGCANIIGIGGLKGTMSYEEAADNAVKFFNRVKAHLEDKGVSIVTEVVNTRFTETRLGRAGQVCDHIAWAADVMKRVNSPRVKVLMDFYHAQIMDGDLIRREIDDTQEINYRAIAKAIADLGFQGYVAHEYSVTPGRDPAKSLREAVEIMRV